MKNQKSRIGIDFGRVIMCAVQNGVQDTSFLGVSFEAAMKTPATPGAIECIGKLVQRYDGRVFIVSKCGESVENKTRGWLSRNDVYAKTGLSKDQVHFCKKRKDKAPICRKFGITHFIDDRVDVLSHMVGIVPNLYLFGEQSKSSHPPWAEALLDWEQVGDCLL
jgi:hypothetical protein